MELLYTDEKIIVCIKPAGVVSTDAPGGLPELVRQALRDADATVRTVHRLDQAVSGVMVLARTARAAGDLSAQIRDRSFQKCYLAVLHGCPAQPEGTLTDLLLRDKARRLTLVAQEPGKDVQPAELDYRVLARSGALTLVQIRLKTGRTHQIRAQFSSRELPLVGDRKYGRPEEDCGIALWSYQVGFCHPKTGETMAFCHLPPMQYPWSEFEKVLEEEICSCNW